MASTPPSSRSTTASTPSTVPPAARTASTALSAEPPVVITSSITTTRSPLRYGPSMSLPVPCVFASFRTVKARTGVPASALAWAIAYDTGSAPRVSPPTASGVHPASRIAASPSGPIVASPSGLIVVSRQSTYSVDCRPEARVKLPRFAERSASIESRRSVGVMRAEVRRA